MELPRRKKLRLVGYDYSKNGAYFLTICIQDRHGMLGKIAEDSVSNRSHIVAGMHLSQYGQIVEKHITSIDSAYAHLFVDKYVIMPNHIHFIICVQDEKLTVSQNGVGQDDRSGTSRTPSPTNAAIPSFVSTFKRFVNKEIGFSLFQRSYHDHIIRNEQEYRKIWDYIDTNPQKWAEDCFYIRG